MTYPVFPSNNIYGFSIVKKPTYKTLVQTNRSGREITRYQNLFPLWEFELRSESMRDETQNSTPYAQFDGIRQFQQISELFVACAGQFGRFYFEDTSDCSRSGQVLGLGDGVETDFVLVRTIYEPTNGIYFTEPVGGANTDHTMAVYVNGTLVPAIDWSLSADLTTIVFDTAPASGAQVTVDFYYYYLCRFIVDELNFEQFFMNHWSIDSIRFRSINPHGTAVPGFIGDDPLTPPPDPEPPVEPICSAETPDSFAICMGPNGRLWNGAPSNVPANSPYGVFSIWFNGGFGAAFSDTLFMIANVTSNVIISNIILGFGPSRFLLNGVVIARTETIGLTYWGGVPRDSWHHLLISWDGIGNILQIALDGAMLTENVGYDKVANVPTSTLYSTIAQFGPNAVNNINLPTNTWNHGTYSDVFLGIPTSFFNLLTPGNIEKFYDDGPVDVSANPTLPLGAVPFICLHGTQDTYGSNFGNGGDLTALGTPDCFNFNISPYD